MTDALLTILRWCLLGLLYLFFFRVLQATWAGSRPATVTRRPQGGQGGGPAAGPGGQGLSQAPRIGRSKRSLNRGGRPRSGPPRLAVVEPAANAGREYLVTGELTIGRAASCSITLDDTYISQLHARVWLDGEEVAVEDLGSTNGTYLNSQRVTTKQCASPGDPLRLGGVVLELR